MRSIVKIAVLFPGQGSQYPGMADPWAEHPAGEEVLAEASDVLGYDIVATCRDEERLADTSVVQPALFACDLAAFRVLESEGLEFEMAAGHSLGEFVALSASGAVDPREAIEAVVERGRAMQEASEARSGGMTALLGLSAEEAAAICATAGRGDVLTVANENSPKQTVVSGTLEAIERAEEMARSRGARVVRLNVAGAFHSPLMQPALSRVRQAIARMTFREPRFPIVPNASARPSTHPSALRDLLSRHLVSPVRWERSMRAMADAGVELFVEAGPGEVLSKLVKRCVPGARGAAVGSPAEADALASEIGARA
ncbi:MAG TPA: ACP S-malonyltransferase [Actinomycetota bacterium]|nr:ACP S-malonyltransferase [Actinomycetota bacterium]